MTFEDLHDVMENDLNVTIYLNGEYIEDVYISSGDIEKYCECQVESVYIDSQKDITVYLVD